MWIDVSVSVVRANTIIVDINASRITHPFVSLQFLPYEAQFRGIFKFDSILNAALSCEWCVYLKTVHEGYNDKVQYI